MGHEISVNQDIVTQHILEHGFEFDANLLYLKLTYFYYFQVNRYFAYITKKEMNNLNSVSFGMTTPSQ